MAFLGALQTVAPYHLLLFSLLFGSTTYQSFYNGIVAYKVLPLKEFANLQGRIFPTYFTFQTISSALLLVTPPFALGSAGFAMLGTSAVTSAINMAILGPKSNVIKAKRDRQMEIEGKSYKDPTASEDMKALNRQFGKLHGMSVSLNLVGWVAMVLYGVYLSDGLVRKIVRK